MRHIYFTIRDLQTCGEIVIISNKNLHPQIHNIFVAVRWTSGNNTPVTDLEDAQNPR